MHLPGIGQSPMSSSASVNTLELSLHRPWLMLGLFVALLILCLGVSIVLPIGNGWKAILILVELLYALPIGYIWWRSRPRRLRLSRDGQLCLWFPGGHRLDTRVEQGATVHRSFVVIPLPQRVGFAHQVLVSREMAGREAFRRLRAWMRTLPHG